MAGHSKWANIKYKKERADLKKGKIFTRVTKEIISAVKEAGSDPKSNARLRQALEKAKAVNLPQENIERNIKKATSQDQADYAEISYEIYGHGGVGLIVEILTDNRNRAASDMRIATNKKGGTIANPGSVAFNFDKKGIIEIDLESAAESVLLLDVLDAGAEDFHLQEELYLVITDPKDLYLVKEILEKKYKIESFSLKMIPKTFVECTEEIAQANEELMAWLEELDDVNEVYHNMA